MIELSFPVIGGAFFGVGLSVWLNRQLKHEQRWEYRQQAHLLELAVPVVISSLIGWHIFEDLQAYPLGASWLIDVPLWILLGLLALTCSAIISYIARHWHLGRQLHGYSQVDEQVQNAQCALGELSQIMGIRPPVLRRLLTRKPTALVVGFFHPVIYLSSWYFEGLSQEKLRTVLAHELAHVVRRDNLIAALSTGLLGGALYSSFSRHAFGGLLRERELAADEWAATVTGEPLKLAKVLLDVSEGNPSTQLLECCSQGASVEERVEQLIRLHKEQPSSRLRVPSWKIGMTWTAFALVALICADLLPHLLDRFQ